MQCSEVILFFMETFQLHVSSHCLEMIENANVFSGFLKKTSLAWQGQLNDAEWCIYASLIWPSVYDECKYLDTFWLADHTRLFVQYTISISSLCKYIWRHRTYKMPVRYILSSVWVRLSTFSSLSIIQYVGLYVFSLPISVMMIEWIYMLCLIIIIKSEVWTITHCLGLGHEKMVSTVCLSKFLLVQITACHLEDAKSLSKPMLEYY